jgi:hypothetical protein
VRGRPALSTPVRHHWELSAHSELAAFRFAATAKAIETEEALPSPGERFDIALSLLIGLLGVSLFLYLLHAVVMGVPPAALAAAGTRVAGRDTCFGGHG